MACFKCGDKDHKMIDCPLAARQHLRSAMTSAKQVEPTLLSDLGEAISLAQKKEGGLPRDGELRASGG